MKHFNTTGPCIPEDHYMLPASPRLPEMHSLIDQKLYFVLHAARQTGKTTSMMALARELSDEGRYAAIVLSVQPAPVFSHDIDTAEKLLLDAWRDVAEDELPVELRPPEWRKAETGQRIRAALRAWARAIPRPLVVFLDEIDGLEDELLLSVLHQLRDGFPHRPNSFPWSLALIGMRDVHDYKVKSATGARLRTSSPFNIKARSLTMGNFTADEVATLYGQHTTETGQVFTPEARDRAFELTQGQPWLVNALARVAVEELVTDMARPVTIEQIEQAREILIQRLAVAGCLLLAVPAYGTVSAATCEGMAELKLPNTTITAAQSVPPTGSAAPYKELPAFCRVAGVIKPTSDSEIKFEVWLPSANCGAQPFALGSVIPAMVSAAVSYPLMLYILRAYRRKHHRRGPGPSQKE